MTRSIGDWCGPDAVLPHPELEQFEVQGHARAVIASDGLWDVCSRAEAARIWPLRLFGHWHAAAVAAEVPSEAGTSVATIASDAPRCR